jgi:hypothetical protein
MQIHFQKERVPRNPRSACDDRLTVISALLPQTGPGSPDAWRGASALCTRRLEGERHA